MHGIAVGEAHAALVGDVADGVVAVGAVFLRLVGPKRAGGGCEPV
jgi:hypothetical protein